MPRCSKEEDVVASSNTPPDNESTIVSPTNEHPDASAIVKDCDLPVLSIDTVSSASTLGPSNDDVSSKTHAVSGDDPSTTAQNLSSVPAVLTSSFRSKAYEKACEELAKEQDDVLNEDDAKTLLKKIDEEYDGATQNNFLLHSVGKFQKAQPLLEGFAFAVDLISFVGSLHPAASTAISVIKGVATMAVAISKSGSALANEQEKMLRKLEHVYRCEHLSDGQPEESMFKSLVQVYRSLLEYYIEARGIFRKNSVMMAISLCGENNSLSEKVKGFIANVQYLECDIELFTANHVKASANHDLDEKVSKRLAADALSTQYGYHDKLKMVREDKACSFMIDANDIYTRLFMEGPGRVLITGSIGCGKSVIMSFLVDKFFNKGKEQHKDQGTTPIICSYYCCDDDSGNLLSVLRGLILAILDQVTDQKRDFEEWCQSHRAFSLGEPIASPKELEMYLGRVVKRLDRPVLLAIDGLDECDDVSRTALLTILDNLSGEIAHVRFILTSRTDIVVSGKADQSVHRVHLRPGSDRDRLIVEKQINDNMKDYSEEIKQYVSEKLSYKAQGCAVWIRMVVSTIRSSRITLKEGMEAFLREMPLPDELSNMYQNLFRHCTTGCSCNTDIAWSALKILASTRRDLTIKELAWGASMANARPSESDKEIEIAKIKMEADCDRIWQLIRPFITELNSSAGTVATNNAHLMASPTDTGWPAKFEIKSPTLEIKSPTFEINSPTFDPNSEERFKIKLRLGHQSVKEFIIAYGNASGSDIASAQAPLPASKFRPEQFMKDVCIRYLLLKDINEKSLFADSKSLVTQLPQLIDPMKQNAIYEKSLPKYTPKECDFGGFFAYASCYWVDHMEKDESPETLALDNLEKLCKYKSQRLDNWTKQICRPNCTWQPRYELNNAEFDPLVVAAFFLPTNVLIQVLQQGRFDGGCYGSEPLLTATSVLLQYNKFSRLKALLTSHRSKDRNEIQMLQCLHIIIQKWKEENQQGEEQGNRDTPHGTQGEGAENSHVKEVYRKHWDELFGLVEERADIMVTERWANDLFCLAAGEGCMPIVERLIQAARSNRRLRAAIWGTKRHPASPLPASAHQSVGYAAANGDRRMVEFLLRYKHSRTHLCYTDAEGRTVLHMAAQRCDPGIVRALLLQLRVGGLFHIGRVDNSGRTPAETALQSDAAEVDREEARRLLQEAQRSQDMARLRLAVWALIWCALMLALVYGGFQFVLTVLVWRVTKTGRLGSRGM
ncbi:Ankyrin repeat-containing domain protein [Cordyceps fumosorosea ARSEF 2679]|uniref:Ankyrin repeat-containing domain protein n=1 Tax=Cordyceps fumosorosea (strain ARSEF 2679) TaxID=1081104 RepID=A0A167TJ88_CORFA|nr:Ankyrin repeat-containing domain protein [Cordyceps fumosorosea ARSEF 2679]OAA60653.1 Ankyrin repeat-containing domain protein [Cordyceps fumosorosea ARSEF 2679]